MVHAMKNYRSMAERWLWLGVAALAVAGLYALVPVAGRTPQLKALNIMQQLFDVALVVHVDLSVLIWSLAMLGLGLALVGSLATRLGGTAEAGHAAEGGARFTVTIPRSTPTVRTLDQ